MKSTIESLSGLEKKLNIEIPQDLVNQEFDKAYKYLQKEVEVKGFRKGKAPITKIKAVYADKVKDDVAQNLVQSHYWTALQEHKLTPVSMPSIDFGEVSENTPFNFTAQFEIRPDINIVKKAGFTVDKEKLVIDDKRIDDVIQNIRESHSSLEPVKLIRPIKEGDFAVIDFEGFIDDKPLENGAATDHVLEIGSNQFIPGFEEKLIGMQKDDNKQVMLTFPEDYHVDELKGKPVMFKVAIKEVKAKVIPELDEEFLKKVEQTNVADFRKQVQDDLESTESRRIETDLREKLMKAFVEANPVDVPNSLMDEQRKALVADFQGRLKQQGFSDENFDEYQKKWDTDFDETAKFMVQSAFLIDKLSEEENLKASDADVDKKVDEMAKQVGIEREKVLSYYKEQNGLSKLQYQITEDKVYNYLLEKSTVNEVEKKEDEEKKDA